MSSTREMVPGLQSVGASPTCTPPGEKAHHGCPAESLARTETSACEANDGLSYRLLVEHANDAMVVLQHGQVVYQNTALMAMLGYSVAELTQRDFTAFVTPEDRRRVAEYYYRRLRGEPVPDQYTVDLVSRAGTRLTVEVKPRIITYQGQLATLIVARNITQQLQAEQAFQKAHQRTMQLLGAIPSLLIGLDINTTIVWWNTTAERLLGCAASEVIGQPLSACGIPWDGGTILQGLATCQAIGEPVRLDDIAFQRPDGSKGSLGIGISLVSARKDEELCFLLMGQDITRRRQLESQLGRAQKLEAIGQLAAGIAHEINTPTQYIGDNIRFLQAAFSDLTTLLAQYEALRQGASTGQLPAPLLERIEAAAARVDVVYLLEEIPQAIQQTVEGVERVAKIVQAMKDFSHPGTGHKTPIDLNRAIESTITVARNEWKYIADMVLDLEPFLPPVPCFLGELNQVVLNLIVNAAHAIGDIADSGGAVHGRITVSTRQEGDWVILCIADTGPGIPEAIRDKIFDPFFTTKDVGKGTGQGLAIAYDVVVQKHGGTLTFDTVEGQGTTFIIRLPLEEAAA